MTQYFPKLHKYLCLWTTVSLIDCFAGTSKISRQTDRVTPGPLSPFLTVVFLLCRFCLPSPINSGLVFFFQILLSEILFVLPCNSSHWHKFSPNLLTGYTASKDRQTKERATSSPTECFTLPCVEDAASPLFLLPSDTKSSLPSANSSNPNNSTVICLITQLKVSIRL